MGKHDPSDMRSKVRRDIGAWGRYRTGRGVARDVRILDVNEYGCRFSDKYSSLKMDDQITLKIGNVGPIMTSVRWREGSVVGTEFVEPLYGPVLDHITQYFDERSAAEKAMLSSDET